MSFPLSGASSALQSSRSSEAERGLDVCSVDLWRRRADPSSMSSVAPDCAAALQFAQGLCELGRFGEATGVARRVIAIEPHNAFAWCVMAQGQLGQGQDNAALLAAQAAISQTSDAEWALRLASAALSRLGRSADAEAAAERAREIPRRSAGDPRRVRRPDPRRPRRRRPPMRHGQPTRTTSPSARSGDCMPQTAPKNVNRPRDCIPAPRTAAAHTRARPIRARATRTTQHSNLRSPPGPRRRAHSRPGRREPGRPTVGRRPVAPGC